MSSPVHWLNLKAGADPGVSDRGFRYGDSLFETLRYYRGHWQLLDFHLQRLQLGCEVLDIPFPKDDIQVQLALAVSYLQEQSLEEACGRLVVTRGDSDRGYAAICESPNLVFSLTAVSLGWRAVQEPARLIRCDLPLASQPRLAGLKHGNRLEQVLAAREVTREHADEGLLLNAQGEIVSAVSANVFGVFDGCLLTPSLHACGVAGTVRRLILEELATAAGMDVEVATICWADLQQAEELFLTNSLVGIWSVEQCPGRNFTSTRWGDTLRELFFERLDPTSA
jgi:4-amino-4-deoxychorismate lyase